MVHSDLKLPFSEEHCQSRSLKYRLLHESQHPHRGVSADNTAVLKEVRKASNCFLLEGSPKHLTPLKCPYVINAVPKRQQSARLVRVMIILQFSAILQRVRSVVLRSTEQQSSFVGERKKGEWKPARGPAVWGNCCDCYGVLALRCSGYWWEKR